MATNLSLVVLTPIKQSADHNIVRIHREMELDGDRLFFVASGPHTGIIINKLTPNLHTVGDPDVDISFSVWVTDGNARHQEKRSLTFNISKKYDVAEGKEAVHRFFTTIRGNMPDGYASFMMLVLRLMQHDYPEIDCIDIDYKTVAEEEEVVIPDAAQYDSSSEAEEVTVGHVQEVLEHAYPNGLTIEVICEALRCSEEEALQFLLELESSGIVRREGDEWIRVDTRNVDAVARGGQSSGSGDHPTVAIITCLFNEKQAVDALIEDSSTIHKYKSGGDSNVYTIGRIGAHRVVATKLGLIGDSREAITSSGSITTRLLGNFQRIEHVLIVGAGGAVPHYTNANLHARLGDVVVSASQPDAYVYAHDLLVDRKTEALTGFAVRKWNPTDHVMARIVRDGGEELQSQWNMLTVEAIARLSQQGTDCDFSAPPPSSDVLALPVKGGNVVVMPHPNEGRKGFEYHLGSTGAVASLRKQSNEAEPEEETAGQVRERFAAEYKLRAVDAGFDSVVAAIVGSRIDSWALIRGIADYQHGQSRAAKKWMPHASARAAAMARAIIEHLPAP